MDFVRRVSPQLGNVPLIPLPTADLPENLPLYGPLDIKNYKIYLDRGRKIFQDRYSIKFPSRVALDEFKFLNCLAKGGFGNIILAERKNDKDSVYAMKAISKTLAIEKNLVKHVLNEKRILQSLRCPFCVRLEHFAETVSHIYLFLPFISGGDIFTHLRQVGKFDEHLSKFYAAQVVLAVEFMHHCGVIHRDLKPENILLDHFGFVKITDFGFAKVVDTRTYTFCGTVEYTAPEVLLGKGYGKTADWWSLGVLIFEMNSGRTPFTADDELVMLEKILLTEFTYPEDFSPALHEIVGELLVSDVTRRLGNLQRGVDDVKEHPWFRGINWLGVLNRQVAAPFVPQQTTKPTKVNFPLMTFTPSSSISLSQLTSIDENFVDF